MNEKFFHSFVLKRSPPFRSRKMTQGGCRRSWSQVLGAPGEEGAKASHRVPGWRRRHSDPGPPSLRRHEGSQQHHATASACAPSPGASERHRQEASVAAARAALGRNLGTEAFL